MEEPSHSSVLANQEYSVAPDEVTAAAAVSPDRKGRGESPIAIHMKLSCWVSSCIKIDRKVRSELSKLRVKMGMWVYDSSGQGAGKGRESPVTYSHPQPEPHGFPETDESVVRGYAAPDLRDCTDAGRY